MKHWFSFSVLRGSPDWTRGSFIIEKINLMRYYSDKTWHNSWCVNLTVWSRHPSISISILNHISYKPTSLQTNVCTFSQRNKNRLLWFPNVQQINSSNIFSPNLDEINRRPLNYWFTPHRTSEELLCPPCGLQQPARAKYPICPEPLTLQPPDDWRIL